MLKLTQDCSEWDTQPLTQLSSLISVSPEGKSMVIVP